MTLLDWLQRLPSTQAAARDVVANVMSWGLLGAADQWNQRQRPLPVELAAQQAVDVLLMGVSQSLGVALPA
jgi:hypothetical protein